MIDYKPTLVSQLETLGLPVQYELFVDSSTTTPCITYMEIDNHVYTEADNLRYGYVTFRIKLWGDDLSVLSPKRSQIDDLMFSLGFTRTSYNELWMDNQVSMIMDYQGISKEK